MALIAVVDDESEIRNILEIQLKESGHKVSLFDSGESFLEALKQVRYDLVLLDIMMEPLTGYEVLAHIRNRSSDAAVVFLTAKTFIQDKVKGLNLGADDYIPKPFTKNELLARISSVLRRREQYQDALQQIKKDLFLARKVQENILPRNFLYTGLEFYAAYLPLNEVGGDFYDIHELTPGTVRVLLADATGNGIQAAFITMLIKAEYEKLKMRSAPPAEILSILNRQFIDHYQPLAVFFTCFIADIDLTKGTITYTSAGHPPQYLISRGKATALNKTGKMAGLVDEKHPQTASIKIDRHSRLFLFTDGLTEQTGADNSEFGEKRLLNTILSSEPHSVKESCDRIQDELKIFCGGSKFKDDITLLALEIK